ncbi:polysaccharide deacetylase family protein [Candidatus Saccharibacteria bacterium]|nr:polysaccharide deacetylase family protein [Candidatus Saccharibacteria bacterium]
MARRTSFLTLINRRWPWLKLVVVAMVMVVIGVEVGFGRGQNNGSIGDVENRVMGGDGVVLDGKEDGSDVVKNVEGDVGDDGEVYKKFVQDEQIASEKKLIALTFDDGPDETRTEKILGVLKEKSVRATFFTVGIMIERYPGVARKVAEAGHEVETHSMRHRNLTELTELEVEDDIRQAREVLRADAGVEAGILRPPYGAVNEIVKGNAAKMGVSLIGWSVDPKDWSAENAEEIKRRVVETSYDGAIILMHDIYDRTVEAVGGIIDELRGQGYEFVTVKELAERNGVELSSEIMYRDLSKD